MKSIRVILPLILLIASCSVNKRIYRNGYYVQWNHQKDKSEIADSRQENKVNYRKELPDDVTASSDQSFSISLKTKLILPDDTCGDKLFLKNGEIITAKITEISETEIRYKRCDNIDGPNYVIPKYKVQMVRYVNGITESFEDIKEPPVSPQSNVSQPTTTLPTSQARQNINGYEQPPKVNRHVWWSLILFCLFPFSIGITLIFAYIHAKKAKEEIKENPKKYKGYILASILKTLSLVIMVFIGLILLITILKG